MIHFPFRCRVEALVLELELIFDACKPKQKVFSFNLHSWNVSFVFESCRLQKNPEAFLWNFQWQSREQLLFMVMIYGLTRLIMCRWHVFSGIGKESASYNKWWLRSNIENGVLIDDEVRTKNSLKMARPGRYIKFSPRRSQVNSSSSFFVLF